MALNAQQYWSAATLVSHTASIGNAPKATAAAASFCRAGAATGAPVLERPKASRVACYDRLWANAQIHRHPETLFVGASRFLTLQPDASTGAQSCLEHRAGDCKVGKGKARK